MAKATSKEKGAGAQSHLPRASGGADAPALRARPDDEPGDAGDAEMALTEEGDIADDDGADESLHLDRGIVPSVGGGALTQAPTRVVSHGVRVPEPLMRNPITRFMAESYIELRKVTWPTRAEAWNMTLIVIAMSAAVAVVLATADQGLARFLAWVISLGAGHTAPTLPPTHP